MTISVIRDAMLHRTSKTDTPTLRNGQIVQGKILKIHPNNKASIQVGSNKMIAEITTPLTVGKEYFFQVEATDQLIQLRVISDQLKQSRNQNIVNLLNQLGIKATRVHAQFVHKLINEKIPFNYDQLQGALQIIEKSSNKQEAMSVLKEMLITRLPITNNVHQALLSNQSSTISPFLTLLKTELSQLPQLTEVEQRALDILKDITKRPLPTHLHVVSQLMNERASSRESILNLLKLTGFVRHDVPTLNLQVNEPSQMNDKHEVTLQNIWSQLTKSESRISPAQIETNKDADALRQTFQQLTKAKHTIQPTARKIISIFHPLQTNSLSTEQFASFRSMVIDQLLPQLPEATKEVLVTLLQQNRPENQAQIFQIVKTLVNDETYQLAQSFVRVNESDATILNQPIQKQFLSHVNQYFQSIGIADEHVLKTQLTNASQEGNLPIENRQAHTVKSLLIQMIQQDSNLSGERAQQMIHFINGMQLQSVQESNNFIHAALQIPGGKLGLNEDIYMQFEGKKADNEQIDPNYCRVLFVLDLKNLRETIIDMHVQKRIVSVTIYNESSDLTNQITGLQTMLDNNLKKLDYHLSSVTFKGLHEQKKDEVVLESSEKKTDYNKGRFDFLV